MKKIIEIDRRKIEVEPIEIGDRIKVISTNNWDTYGYKGTIIGFSQTAQARYPNPEGIKPGIYENKWWCEIEFDKKKNGKNLVKYVSSCNIEVLNKKKWRAELFFNDEEKFIEDLPETKFYELDKVKVRRENKNMLVGEINYDKIIEKQSWGSLYHLVYSADDIGNGVAGYAENKDLSLIKRSNVWNYYHNNEALSFKNIGEEADFYINFGKVERLSYDSNGKYFTKESVLKEIRAKNVDGFVLNNKEITALKFKDNLGERVRRMTLKGFRI